MSEQPKSQQPQQQQQQQDRPQGADRAPSAGFDMNVQQPASGEARRPFSDWASI